MRLTSHQLDALANVRKDYLKIPESADILVEELITRDGLLVPAVLVRSAGNRRGPHVVLGESGTFFDALKGPAAQRPGERVTPPIAVKDAPQA